MIIIDSNVLFSALIKDSVTRGLILECNDSFLFPEFIFEEMDKHKSDLMKKSGMFQDDFNALLRLILKKVMIVPDKVLIPYKEEALEIIKDIDKDDVIFIACALAYPDSVIWSDDKQLKKQTRVRILNTKEMIDLA